MFQTGGMAKTRRVLCAENEALKLKLLGASTAISCQRLLNVICIIGALCFGYVIGKELNKFVRVDVPTQSTVFVSLDEIGHRLLFEPERVLSARPVPIVCNQPHVVEFDFSRKALRAHLPLCGSAMASIRCTEMSRCSTTPRARPSRPTSRA